MSDTDLGSLDALSLARLFKSRDASPIEATRALLSELRASIQRLMPMSM
ncbi:hypothetical protein [Vreelandella sulfidaeris]|nr:hypothetical protein [Halomonas sulfidaeris]